MAMRHIDHRGSWVLAVIDRDLDPPRAAAVISARLADELPPRHLHVIRRDGPVWLRALGFEPGAVSGFEVDAAWYADDIAGWWCDPPCGELLDRLAPLGCPITTSWSRAGWRATLRTARRRHQDADLFLAVSGRPRFLPGRRRGPRPEALVAGPNPPVAVPLRH